MFTKGLPLGKRPIYCSPFSPDPSRFFSAWLWEDFLNYNRGMDRYSSCFFGQYQSVWTKRRRRLDCGNDSPMLQMMRKDEAPYRVSSLSWTLLKTENHQNLTPRAVYLKMTEHKSLWQNYNERQINTNTRVKWKTAALIRQANNWNQIARWKGWWKWQRKIKEKVGWIKIHYSHPIKNHTW